MSDSDNEEEIFETLPQGSVAQKDEPINKKKGKHKKVMSEERKEQLREQLKKARAASLAKRKLNAKKKKETKAAVEIVSRRQVRPEVVGVADRSDVEEEMEVVKKPRKKNVRIVEETEDEMESRIEKRIRLKLEKEREKEEKEKARQKELDDLKFEVAFLKRDKEEKKKKKEEEEVVKQKQLTESIENDPIPQFSQFSIMRKNRYRKF